MALAFTLEACANLLPDQVRPGPEALRDLQRLTFFGWGEIYSLCRPSAATSSRTKHATRTTASLHGPRARLSVLVPLGSALAAGKGVRLPGRYLLAVGGALALFRTSSPHHAPPALDAQGCTTRSSTSGSPSSHTGSSSRSCRPRGTPSAAKFALPRSRVGRRLSIAIGLRLRRGAIAFFGLRRMSVPAMLPSTKPAAAPDAARAAAQ